MSTIQYEAVVTRVPASQRKGSHVAGFLQPARSSEDWPRNVPRAGLPFRVDDVKGGNALVLGCSVRFTLMRGTDGYLVKHVYAQQPNNTPSPSLGSSASSTASISRTSSYSSSYLSRRALPSTAGPVIAAPGLSQISSWRSPRPSRPPALRHSKHLSQTDLRTAYDIGLLQKSNTF